MRWPAIPDAKYFSTDTLDANHEQYDPQFPREFFDEIVRYDLF